MIAKAPRTPSSCSLERAKGPLGFARRSRGVITLGATALVLLATACGPSATEQKAKLDAIQKSADDRVAQLTKQAKDQLADAQKQIADLQQKLTDAATQAKAEAHAEAEEEVNKAHAEADKLAAEAAKALSKARVAYKESERHDLTDLSKDIDQLRVKAAKAPAKIKPQIDKSMKDLVTKRDAAAKEILEIDKATLETLQVAKNKVAAKLAVLKQAVHALQAKLP